MKTAIGRGGWMRRWVSAIVDLRGSWFGARQFPQLLRDWREYSRMPGAEKVLVRESHPRLRDRTSATPVDPHYFYQGVWAFSRILKSRAQDHVDVGSSTWFVALLSCITRVTFVDIRRLPVKLSNFHSIEGDVLNLPLGEGSVESLSSLHVIEHVGLGRYGDQLDPSGTIKAARALAGVLTKGGNLFVSLPVGRPRVQFNAHRILAPKHVLDYFGDLDLVEFCAVDDAGEFVEEAAPSDFTDSEYACAMFWFRKPQ